MTAHLKSLEKKHSVLDEQIRLERAHASCNDVLLRQMKEQKLHLREEIERLRRPV